MAFELTSANAVGYLSQHRAVEGAAVARLLGGGVSNTVVLVESARERIILKQSLPQLRVKDEWLADRSRIFRERDAIQALTPILPSGRLPRILFSVEEDFLYAMEAAAVEAVDWKTHLLAGVCERETARQAGITLGLMIRETWRRHDFEKHFGDQTAFEQLRTDAYYRTVGERHPAIRQIVDNWIEAQRGRHDAIVHGDWSPKNLLVSPAGLTAIDFECAHFGDPSYDAAFLTNHFILKAFHRPELSSHYLELARVAFTWTLGMLPTDALSSFERNTVRHLSFLLLARVDGKSPAEYISDEKTRATVRRCALELITERPARLTKVFQRVESAIPNTRRSPSV